MNKALAATQQFFESSSGKTPQYLTWHRLFKREFTKFLKSRGMTDIDVRKPNHFDLYGFFKDGNSQIWYFSVSDIRSFKNDMLIRTAKHFKDFTGGPNEYIPIDTGIFEAGFDYLMKRYNFNKFQASLT